MPSSWKEFRNPGSVSRDERMKKLGLLVVDDESDIVDSLGEMFREYFDIYQAYNTHEALALFKEHSPKLVLTDQRMPDMTGLKLLRQLREISPDVVAILVTGYSDISVVVEALNAGLVWKYVTKPWEHAELRKLVLEGARDYLRREGLDDGFYRFRNTLGC